MNDAVDPDQPRRAALVGEVASDRRPASALRERLVALDTAGDAASAVLGTKLFESIFYRLPAFPDDRLPAVASRLFARAGHPDVAFLLAGLAVQLEPADGRPVAPHRALLEYFRHAGRHADAAAAARRAGSLFPGQTFAPDPIGEADPLAEAAAAKAAAIAASSHAGGMLLLALEACDPAADWRQAALLFESVWHRVPPIEEYWVYHRMSAVYDALGRADASTLMATLAVQIEPGNPVSDAPHRRLLRGLRDAGRLRDAAELCLRRQALCPAPALLADAELAALLEAAGPLSLSSSPAGRRDRIVIGHEIREPRPWPLYGGSLPRGFDELLGDMARPAISVAELADAEMLVDGGAVAVFGPDGMPHLDMSVRMIPALLRRRQAAAERAGQPIEEIGLDEAVFIGDEFPGPNLCHFLFDHATRIEVYRRAGVDIAQVTVIGPELRSDYQRVVAGGLGVRAYLPVTRRARLRIGRLWVGSNCHDLRHPAHWAADWAMASLRALFDLAPRRPPRRLLVSRVDSPWRRLGNEAEVAAVLAPLGFEVIVPGRLAFADQIAAFRDATHVVAPHGAGLANILFCAPGTQVLEVFHPHYGTWAYAMLNASLGLRYASMVARDALSDAPEFNDLTLPRERIVAHAGRDMRVDLAELRRWLAESGAC